jgi:hypothetical protein
LNHSTDLHNFFLFDHVCPQVLFCAFQIKMSVPINIRIQIVLLMAKFESITVVKRKLQAEFGSDSPGEVCIRETFKRFCETASVDDRSRSGRPTAMTEEKIDEIRQICENSPQSSVRVVAQASSSPSTTVYRIMTEHLLLKPYKMQFLQQLYEEDFQDRVEMCEKLIPMLEDAGNKEKFFFSDEATFYLNGLVNKHNVRYWSQDNPHATIETVMKSPKLNVWCAMSENRLIGPFFFDCDTVSGENYLSMLQDFWIPEVRRLHILRSIIFQQDGAPAHWYGKVRQLLHNMFPNRWVGRDGPIRWAPRSPDLTPLDFFLWGYLKDNVYKTSMKDLNELKARIANEIRMISKETLCNVFSNILKRMHMCISVKGDHFEQLM